MFLKITSSHSPTANCTKPSPAVTPHSRIMNEGAKIRKIFQFTNSTPEKPHIEKITPHPPLHHHSCHSHHHITTNDVVTHPLRSTHRGKPILSVLPKFDCAKVRIYIDISTMFFRLSFVLTFSVFRGCCCGGFGNPIWSPLLGIENMYSTHSIHSTG